MGKWLIAIGIKIFGFEPFGWRVSSAVFGTLLVLVAYLLARRLFRSRWAAGVAGLLTATDFLLIVQSRVAMLDIFLAFFILLGFLFLAFDRERILLLRENALLPFPGEPPAREPEWRFAAGAALGLAVSVKWSAAFALAGAVLLALGWSADLARATRKRPEPTRLGRELATAVLAFGLVPLVVYVTSYSLWFRDNYADRGAVGAAVAFKDLQVGMFDYHTGLQATHQYQSKAWTWPLVKRPVAYHYAGPPDNPDVHHILAFGNPATWYAALAAAVWLFARSLRPWRGEQLVVFGWGAQYLPWLLVARPLFFFYMTPIVPFMMIGLAGALGALRDRGPIPRRLVTAYLVVGVGLLLLYFSPVVLGTALSSGPGCGPFLCWRSRMWFGSWI